MLSAWILLACSESGFHSVADAQGEESEASRPTDTGEPGNTWSPPADTADPLGDTGRGGPPEDTGPAEHVPETCSVLTMVHMSGSGPQDCPDDHAAFMMDDGDGPNFICCPLPATDILTADPPVSRGTSCASDEVITGFDGAYAYRCTSVNLDRYELGTPSEPCYFGDGSSGWWGAESCSNHPHTWDVVQESYFGSDGCSGYPYGALFTSQTGDDCSDMRAAEVLYNGTVSGDPPAGTAVDMFAN